MFLIRFTIVLFIATLAYACLQEPAAIDGFADGEAPESVLRNYQAFVDNNQFEAAKSLSTEAERKRLSELAAMLAEEPAEAAIFTTNFLRIDCQPKRFTAYCQCLVEDDYERYEIMFKLVKTQGNWRVDAPEKDGVVVEEEVIEHVLDGMNEIAR